MTPAFRAPIAPHVLDRIRSLSLAGGRTVNEIIDEVQRETGVRVSVTMTKRVRAEAAAGRLMPDPAEAVERFEDLPRLPDDADAAEVAARLAAVKAEKVARGDGLFDSPRNLDHIRLGRIAAKERGVSITIPGVRPYREASSTEMSMFHVDDN